MASEQRLREHPAKRFAAPVRILDLPESFAALLSEPHEGTDGHRQITIVHEDRLSVVLFHFEANGVLPEHVIDGEMTLHVIDGALDVRTTECSDTLRSQQLMVVGASIPFTLRATRPTRVVMTVHLRHEMEDVGRDF